MTSCETEKIISFHALKKARSTLEDFAKSYLFFHGLGPMDFFKFMDVLIYVESIIYCIDEMNEEQINHHDGNGDKQVVDQMFLSQITNKEFDEMMNTNKAFKILISFLKANNFYDQKIENEIKDGLLYWKLERFLCDDTNWDVHKHLINQTLIEQCIGLKSFDYRLMNLILYKLRKSDYNEKHLSFLRAHELLIEIGDDLFDYEDDVIKQSFNVYRMFLKLYPSDTKLASLKLSQFISNTEKQYKIFQKDVDTSIVKLHEMRNKTAWKGIVDSDDWIIPSPIIDEVKYRKEVLDIEQTLENKQNKLIW